MAETLAQTILCSLILMLIPPRSLIGTRLIPADIEPEKIYAYRKTGLIVTEENWGLLSEEQQQEWEAAIAEYEERLSGEVQ